MARLNKRQRRKEKRERRLQRGAGRHAPTASVSPEQAVAQTTTAEPIRGATAPVIDAALRWHMIRTAPRLGRLGRESLDKALKKRGVSAHRPRASEVVIRRNRRVIRRTPLLVRTVIVGVRDADHLDEVAALPGVAEVVAHPAPDETAEGNVAGVRRIPARLAPDGLSRFFIALAAGEIVQPVGIRVGQDVVVMAGPFASFPAVVEEILPGDRIKVGVSIFGRTSPVEIGIADVQAV